MTRKPCWGDRRAHSSFCIQVSLSGPAGTRQLAPGDLLEVCASDPVSEAGQLGASRRSLIRVAGKT